MVSKLAACVLALCAVLPLRAAEPPKETLSELLEPIVAEHDVPGMVAGLVVGDQLVEVGSAGVRRRGRDVKLTVDDQFHLGSCTKAMTASLCAVLVEQGKLSWDMSLKDVFGERVSGSLEDITLEQLLQHRSGLTGEMMSDGIFLLMRLHSGAARDARALVLSRLSSLPLEAKPGEKYIYSNFGYMLAGHMAEEVTDDDWETLMRRHIFEPLKMKSAGFGPPGEAQDLTQPRGHFALGQPIEPSWMADNPASIGPAGTVHCNIADWARFVGWHLQGTQGRAELLQAETFKRLHTPTATSPEEEAGLGYAAGWRILERPWGEGRVLMHGGSNTMWQAVVWMAPNRDFAVLVACNQGGEKAGLACDQAASAVIRHHLKE